MTAGDLLRRLAAVTIGQAPRPDLLEPVVGALPADVAVMELGALDGLSASQVPGPPSGGYPLTTRLRDGTPVTIDEASLAPLVQAAVDRADAAAVDVILLLCAGGFTAVTSRAPLIRPFDAAVARLRAMGAHRVAVAVPFEGQATPALSKWLALGLDARAVAGDLAAMHVDRLDPVDAVVLDYVGHAPAEVAAFLARCPWPVIDLGEAGAEAAAARFR